MRQTDFHAAELAEVEQDIAADAIDDPVMARLMTIPGIDVTTAMSIVAAVGDFSRFESPDRLVSYLCGFQDMGDSPAAHGRIAKAGRGQARGMLVEAAFSASSVSTWPDFCCSTAKSPFWPNRSWWSGAWSAPRPRWRRGRRGSSVALLVGYLIGISHVDPLKWDLTLERFISEDMTTLPDIDLDFPRGLRDELIERVHRHFGPEHAVLAGAITTYKAKGIIQDLGKALGLPQERLSLLSKRLHSHHAADLRHEMMGLAEFKDKVDAPGWRDLLDLAPSSWALPGG